MKTRALAISLVTLLALAGSTTASIVPIPTSLWDLIRDADLIVVARVEKVEPPALFHLSVLETWKGVAPPGWLVVSWVGLQEGDLVLAVLQSDEAVIRESMEASRMFDETYRSSVGSYRSSEEVLEPEEEGSDFVSGDAEISTLEDDPSLEAVEEEPQGSGGGFWHPRGEAGMRRVAESELAVLSERIREAVDLQAAGTVSREAYRAWLVSMAERRATRREGLEQMTMGDFRADWPLLADTWRARDVLTDEELARIRDGFIAEPSGDEGLSRIIAFFEGRRDTTFDLAVLSVVEGMLARTRATRQTADAVRDAVMRVTGDERPIAVWVTPEIEQLRSVWAEVRERWKLRRVRPAQIPEIDAER